LILAALAAWSAWPPAALGGEALTLADCLKLAVERNTRMQAADLNVAVRDSEADSVRGRFLPLFKAEANLLGWDSDLSFAVAPPEVPGLPAGQIQTEPVKIRDQLTYGFTASAAQPLVGLYRIYSSYRAQTASRDSARLDRSALRRRLELDVVGAYLGLLSAERMADTASAGVRQAEAYEAQTRRYLENEMVEKNALLKIQVQKAELEKARADAEQTAALLRATLNTLVGRPVEAPLEPSEDGMTSIAPAEPAADASNALAARPDVAALRLQAQAAESARKAALGAMLPDLNAVAQYDYKGGFGPMQPEHAVYGGLVFSWPVWEWGATYYQLQAAERREQLARTAVKQVEEAARLEIEARRVELAKARKAQELTRLQVEYARENLRLEQNRYEARETTTVDLLQAQTTLLKVENDAILADMAARAAGFALEVALGRDLLAAAGEKENP